MTEKGIDRLISLLGDSVTGKSDVLGDAKPSIFFRPMMHRMKCLLSCEPDRMISKGSVAVRKALHPILMLLLPLFLDYKQVIESKNALLGIEEPDPPLELTKESVIWCANHGVKDDAAASLGVVRHSYILFGSLPAFINTLDGVGAYINGVVMCNRKVKKSKAAAQDACRKLLERGMDVLLFPEGVWNKTPNKLMLDLWPGVYRLAKETGCRVIPVIHYLADPHKRYEGNVIHTVVAEPISMEGLTEEEGLVLLRDTMSTWYFLMMEKYGQTTREQLLKGYNTADEAWERYMAIHTGDIKYYDKEIEYCADYRSKDVIYSVDVWKRISQIRNPHSENIRDVLYAKEVVAREQRRDFQRRY